MPRVYGYVRPYPGRLGKQVKDFVEEQGFSLGPGMVVAAGATDTYASRWIMRATMDLLVLPFHLHRGDAGQVLDAIGVLISLPEDVDLGGLPILMPVRAFSWGSSFQRRLELLKDTRPHIAEHLLIAHQDEVGSVTLASRLRRAHSRPISTAPLVRSASIAPPTVREMPAGLWDLSGTVLRDERESASWPTATSSVSPESRPASSRPSETRPTRPPLDGRTDGPSEPAVSVERIKGGALGVDYSAPEQSSSVGRSSLILPRLPSDLESGTDSAQERFRRAAELGAKARKDAAQRKKGS